MQHDLSQHQQRSDHPYSPLSFLPSTIYPPAPSDFLFTPISVIHPATSIMTEEERCRFNREFGELLRPFKSTPALSPEVIASSSFPFDAASTPASTIQASSSPSQPATIAPSSPSPSDQLHITHPGPSSRRGRLRSSTVPGQYVWKLIPSEAPSTRAVAPKCRCPFNTHKPARHWKYSCPDNPNLYEAHVACEVCGKVLTSAYNLKRHKKLVHKQVSG